MSSHRSEGFLYPLLGLVADRLGRDAILIELNPRYVDIARARLCGDAGLFAEVKVE